MTTATLSFVRAQKNLKAKINSIELPAINWKIVCFVGFFASLAFKSKILKPALLIKSVFEKSIITSSYLDENNIKDI